MGQRAKDIAGRIKHFSDEIIAFVEQLSEDDWNKVCDWEHLDNMKAAIGR